MPWNLHTAAQVAAYRRLFPDERERLAPLLHALDRDEAIDFRGNLNGHLTASGIIVSRRGLLTVHHPRLQRWMQPGGHLEPGEGPHDAALRETLEETGLQARLHAWHAAHGCPLDIDVHTIPDNPARGEPPHLHFDFRYLLSCTPSPAGEAELPTRWTALADLHIDALQALMHKLRALRIPDVDAGA